MFPINRPVRAVTRDGGRIHCGSHVSGIEATDDGVTVTTSDGHTVRAAELVVATNSPVNDWVALHTKQAPYRTYAIARRLPRGAMTPMLVWDTLDPYHYVRLQPMGDHDLLIVGGEDHKTGQEEHTEARFAALERWTRERFPEAGEEAEEALEQVERHRPDVVTLDLVMPRMNGYQVLETLKRDATLRHLPVNIISALDEKGHLSRDDVKHELQELDAIDGMTRTLTDDAVMSSKRRIHRKRQCLRGARARCGSLTDFATAQRHVPRIAWTAFAGDRERGALLAEM